MTLARRLAAAAAAAGIGCSELTEAEGGVIGLELRVPSPATVEVGDTLQLSARALNRDGDSVGVTIGWRSADTTVSVDDAGRVVGQFPGTGRVQAFYGPLVSELVAVAVVARPDTLILVGDSVVTVAAGEPGSAPLVVRLETRSPPGPVAGRAVVYEVVSPVFADPAQRTVELPGGVLVDTVATDAEGQVTAVALARVAAAAAPDTAIVQVRASRARDVPVPGSGQRFLVRFE